MAGDPTILVTLSAKRDEIEATIAAYEARTTEARKDLAHVLETMAIFERSGSPDEFRSYYSLNRLWKRGELMAQCKAEIEKDGPLDTSELITRLMLARGMDTADKVMRKTLMHAISHTLTRQARSGRLVKGPKRNNRIVWRLLSPPL